MSYTKEDLEIDIDWLEGFGMGNRYARHFLKELIENCGGTVK